MAYIFSHAPVSISKIPVKNSSDEVGRSQYLRRKIVPIFYVLPLEEIVGSYEIVLLKNSLYAKIHFLILHTLNKSLPLSENCETKFSSFTRFPFSIRSDTFTIPLAASCVSVRQFPLGNLI